LRDRYQQRSGLGQLATAPPPKLNGRYRIGQQTVVDAPSSDDGLGCERAFVIKYVIKIKSRSENGDGF